MQAHFSVKSTEIEKWVHVTVTYGGLSIPCPPFLETFISFTASIQAALIVHAFLLIFHLSAVIS